MMSLQPTLHAATQTRHTILNKDITARLPLCLPPYAIDPTKYYLGMLTFGQIYISFEQAISDALRQSPNDDETRKHNLRLLQILSTDGLPRTDALKHDLELLAGKLSLRDPSLRGIGARVRSQAIEKTQCVIQNITTKPHLALAYTWTMYLALFNGGRWLYKQLAAAGPEFWLEPSDAEQDKNDIQALSFWRFETSQHDPNAEELKLEFKRNFEQASNMLSDTEREEVVKEATDLFDLCLGLIKDLDLAMVNLHQISVSVTTAKASSQAGTMDSIWQTLSSTLVAPALKAFNLRWTYPVSEQIKAGD